MKVGIYKEVHIDTSHACSIIKGNAPTFTGTDGKLRSGWRGNRTRHANPDDYSLVKQVIDKYDHQII